MLNSFELFRPQRVAPATPLERVGDILQYALPWAALLAVALSGHVRGAQVWLWCGALNTLLTHLLKYLFNFTGLGRRPDGGAFSFPSGHTSSAFMGAAFFFFYFGMNVWVLLAVLLAGLTAYSRVEAGRHYWRDVIAGAILAALIVWLVFRTVGMF